MRVVPGALPCGPPAPRQNQDRARRSLRWCTAWSSTGDRARPLSSRSDVVIGQAHMPARPRSRRLRPARSAPCCEPSARDQAATLGHPLVLDKREIVGDNLSVWLLAKGREEKRSLNITV